MHGFLLLATTDDQNLWVNVVDGLRSLTLPTSDTGHVSIWCGLLGELLEAFGNSMHGVNSPAILSEDCIDDGRSKDNLSLEGYNKLQLREVRVRV